MTTHDTPYDANLQKLSDIELIQRIADLHSTVDGLLKEVARRLVVRSAMQLESHSPAAQQTTNASAFDVSFVSALDAVGRC